MPLSNASRLADFGTGIGTAGAIIQVDNANQRLGVGTTAPTATLGVAGIVSATAFYGDGSNLDGVASAGLGTALSEVEFDPLTVIYQTSDTLSVGATITVDPPDATTKVAYTQYAEILLQDDADLIVADGDDFIPDILGLSTEGFSFSNTNGNGIFDTVYTDNIENAAGRGGPNFPLGITVTGISTLSGNVSIGGTLTYEDVTNVDSIGVVTARSGVDINAGGLDITAGGIKVSSGGIDAVGIITASTGFNAASNLILNTGGSERLRIGSAGQLGLGGANYGTSGQVMTSQGASAAPQWADAGGGAWEVVSTHVLSGSTTDIQMYGWSNSYQQYKVVFNDCYNSNDNLMRIRFYTDATSGNNGTIVAASTYKRCGVKMPYGSTTYTFDAGTSSYFYPQIDFSGTEVNNGELIFPMKTTGYSDSVKCYGEWLGHVEQWRSIACEMDTNPTHFLTGIHIYFTETGSATLKAPTTGRITLLRMKYS